MLTFWRWRWLRRAVSFVAHADLIASLYGRLLPKRVRDSIEGYVVGAMFTAVVTVSGTVLAILGSMPLTVVYLTALGSLSAGMVITNQAATWQQRRTRLTPPAPLKAEVEVTEISAGWDGAAAAISVENRGPATAILGEILWVEGYSAASYRLEWEGESSANYPLEVGKHVTAVIASPKARPPEVEGVELHTAGGIRLTLNIRPETADMIFQLSIFATPSELVFQQHYQLWYYEDGSVDISPVAPPGADS